jgi:gas vesicle protein
MFFVGAGMGAAAGMLLAPKSGREIRQELFGGSSDILGEPGTEFGAPAVEVESEEDLKAKIEETRARLKAEIESQQEKE